MIPLVFPLLTLSMFFFNEQTNTFSNSTIETLEEGMKHVQN